LTIPRGKRKRNRAIIAILLPAITFLWIVGWGLYWIDHQKELQKPQPSSSPREEDHVIISPIMHEESLEIES
jgi:hypothetical protein